MLDSAVGRGGRQREHEDAPFAALKDPALHSTQTTLLALPAANDEVPAGHAIAFTVERGQKKPAGQRTGEPEAQ